MGTTGIAAEDARHRVLVAALRVVRSRIGDGTPHQEDDAEAEYADEQLALAALELVAATDALDASAQPVGWRESQTGDMADVEAEHHDEMWRQARHVTGD